MAIVVGLNFNYLFFFILSVFLISSCSGKQQPVQNPDRFSDPNNGFAAKGFQVHHEGKIKILDVFLPWQPGGISNRFYLVNERDTSGIAIPDDGHLVNIPVKRIVCLSATHLSFIDALGVTDKLVGVTSVDYVVSEKFRSYVDSGRIADIGIGEHFQLEKLISLAPDIIMVTPQAGQGFEPLMRAGLTVIPIGEYLEASPLGMVEWLKFVAAFFGKDAEANHIFDSIRGAYDQLKILTKDVSFRPKVLSGKQYGGFWDLPGGRSYVAQMLEDAGANYIYSDDDHTGSLTLGFEPVYAKGIEADYWRLLVYSKDDLTLESLAAEDQRYRDFNAFRGKKVFSCNTMKTPYHQKGILEPQVILADYIKIFYPDLLPDHQPVYFKLLP